MKILISIKNRVGAWLNMDGLARSTQCSCGESAMAGPTLFAFAPFLTYQGNSGLTQTTGMAI
jgi:hypothetical protein